MSLFVQPQSIPPDAVILDARPASEYRAGHVPGAVRVSWSRYRDGWFRVGRLPDNLDKLARKLEKLGVDDERPVVVYDAAHEGWGQAGRVAWMIGYLGHEDVRILDGGYAAWVDNGGEPTTDRPDVERGSFTVQTRSSWRATIDDVQHATENDDVVILDVRSEKEYEGARPYFSKRGGHIPGARHLYWKDLLDEDGKRRTDVSDLMSDLGIDPDTQVITYCTGGVRSAEVLFLLSEAGYKVRNYDGSWWEWSADKNKAVELHDEP